MGIPMLQVCAACFMATVKLHQSKSYTDLVLPITDKHMLHCADRPNHGHFPPNKLLNSMNLHNASWNLVLDLQAT